MLYDLEIDARDNRSRYPFTIVTNVRSLVFDGNVRYRKHRDSKHRDLENQAPERISTVNEATYR